MTWWCHSMLAEWQSVNMMSRRLFGFCLVFVLLGLTWLLQAPQNPPVGQEEAGLPSSGQPSTLAIQDSTGLWLKGKASQEPPKLLCTAWFPEE